MLKPFLQAVVTEKLSDRAYAELHGFAVCLSDFAPGELRLVGSRCFTVLFPNGLQGPEVTDEALAWEMAAYLHRNTVDHWAMIRRSGIELVTCGYRVDQNHSLFVEDLREDESKLDDKVVPVTAQSDGLLERIAAPVARSTRLDRIQLQQEISGKNLPTGREENIALLKKLLPATSTVIYPHRSR